MRVFKLQNPFITPSAYSFRSELPIAWTMLQAAGYPGRRFVRHGKTLYNGVAIRCNAISKRSGTHDIPGPKRLTGHRKPDGFGECKERRVGARSCSLWLRPLIFHFLSAVRAQAMGDCLTWAFQKMVFETEPLVVLFDAFAPRAQMNKILKITQP